MDIVMRTRDVLCPTDFSATASHALKYAVEMANLYHVDIRLLHVTSPVKSAHFYGISIDTPDSVEQELAHFVEQKMQAIQTELQRDLVKGLAVHIVVRHGEPGAEILAETDEVGMVVIASHGNTGLGDFLRHHVSQDIVRLAKCPVLVVK